MYELPEEGRERSAQIAAPTKSEFSLLQKPIPVIMSTLKGIF